MSTRTKNVVVFNPKKNQLEFNFDDNCDQLVITGFVTDIQDLRVNVFLPRVQDVVRGSFDSDLFDMNLAKIRNAASDPIKDVQEVVEVTQKHFGLTDEEGGSLLTRIIDGKDVSRWGLANAITALAHDIDNYDRSVEAERWGGRIVEMKSLKELMNA